MRREDIEWRVREGTNISNCDFSFLHITQYIRSASPVHGSFPSGESMSGAGASQPQGPKIRAVDDGAGGGPPRAICRT